MKLQKIKLQKIKILKIKLLQKKIYKRQVFHKIKWTTKERCAKDSYRQKKKIQR